MAARYEYLVCMVQQDRVTFVNNSWMGGEAPADAVESLERCPRAAEYLQTAGNEGWELVTAVDRSQAEGQPLQVLYLKRVRQ